MYNFQPKALTDRELIKYGGLWLDDESLPIDVQREILLRLGQRCDELEHALAEVQNLSTALQTN